MTRREWWNYYILQWLFIRWAIEVEVRPFDNILKMDQWPQQRTRSFIMAGIWPCTGWNSKPFKYILKTYRQWLVGKWSPWKNQVPNHFNCRCTLDVIDIKSLPSNPDAHL